MVFSQTYIAVMVNEQIFSFSGKGMEREGREGHAVPPIVSIIPPKWSARRYSKNYDNPLPPAINPINSFYPGNTYSQFLKLHKSCGYAFFEC